MLSKIFRSKFTNVFLFILTIFTTSLAGADWIGLPYDSFWGGIKNGLWYAVPFLGILTAHEFGHYIAAKLYKLEVTLPFYIPIYIPMVPSIGTMGAFIQIKSQMKTLKTVFDVGIAGPLAGFVVAVALIWYGFNNLPSKEYIFELHPEYKVYGDNFEQYVYSYSFLRTQDSLACVKNNLTFVPKNEYQVIATGSNLLFYLFRKMNTKPNVWIPNQFEMYHFPFLFAGFLALFFTALNLLPIGQLDGGHILFTMIGDRNYRKVTPILFGVFVYLGTIDFLNLTFDLKPMFSMDDMLVFAPFYILFLTIIFASASPSFSVKLYFAVIIFALQFFTLYLFPAFKGFYGWWVFALLLGRFLGIYHPPCPNTEPIGKGRIVLGIFAFVIFLLSFSPQPLYFVSVNP